MARVLRAGSADGVLAKYEKTLSKGQRVNLIWPDMKRNKLPDEK